MAVGLRRSLCFPYNCQEFIVILKLILTLHNHIILYCISTYNIRNQRQAVPYCGQKKLRYSNLKLMKKRLLLQIAYYYLNIISGIWNFAQAFQILLVVDAVILKGRRKKSILIQLLLQWCNFIDGLSKSTRRYDIIYY